MKSPSATVVPSGVVRTSPSACALGGLSVPQPASFRGHVGRSYCRASFADPDGNVSLAAISPGEVGHSGQLAADRRVWDGLVAGFVVAVGDFGGGLSVHGDQTGAVIGPLEERGVSGGGRDG